MPIKKVLIVDDSPTERHVLTEMLTKQGYCRIDRGERGRGDDQGQGR